MWLDLLVITKPRGPSRELKQRPGIGFIPYNPPEPPQKSTVAFPGKDPAPWRQAGPRKPSLVLSFAASGVRWEPVLAPDDGQMQGVWRGRQHLPPCLGQLPKGNLTDRYSLLPVWRLHLLLLTTGWHGGGLASTWVGAFPAARWKELRSATTPA